MGYNVHPLSAMYITTYSSALFIISQSIFGPANFFLLSTHRIITSKNTPTATAAPLIPQSAIGHPKPQAKTKKTY